MFLAGGSKAEGLRSMLVQEGGGGWGGVDSGLMLCDFRTVIVLYCVSVVI